MLVREKIKLLRQSRKWSQEYLAEKLGMSANGYGAIERGDSRITVDKLDELSRLFEVPFNELWTMNQQMFLSHTIMAHRHSKIIKAIAQFVQNLKNTKLKNSSLLLKN